MASCRSGWRRCARRRAWGDSVRVVCKEGAVAVFCVLLAVGLVEAATAGAAQVAKYLAQSDELDTLLDIELEPELELDEGSAK